MKLKDFLKEVDKTVREHVQNIAPDQVDVMKDFKINSLEDALSVVKYLLEVNSRAKQQTDVIEGQIKALMDGLNINEEDLEGLDETDDSN